MKKKATLFTAILAASVLLAACGNSETGTAEKQEERNSFTTGQEPMTVEKESGSFHLLAKIYSRSSDTLTVEGRLTYTGEKPATIHHGMAMMRFGMMDQQKNESVDEMVFPDIAYKSKVKPSQTFHEKRTFNLDEGRKYVLTIESTISEKKPKIISFDPIAISW
ncbi:hypothetical protein [Sediminibacillus albus]|uniref:Uncharacterized protein n=1 Tax=Sediminibacillus albus TaxID=407036 RepID=A0A1G9B4Z6_9BACI|nr:hypothetical protein [Sediminibacillus albus]SDK34559.1 hypothetical protein SAMN05216243_2812 [Sediminibacillus albus]